MKTSPPVNIKNVITMSWELEKTSISKVDILETVTEETLVKNKSKFVVDPLLLGFKFLRIKKPKTEMKMK